MNQCNFFLGGGAHWRECSLVWYTWMGIGMEAHGSQMPCMFQSHCSGLSNYHLESIFIFQKCLKIPLKFFISTCHENLSFVLFAIFFYLRIVQWGGCVHTRNLCKTGQACFIDVLHCSASSQCVLYKTGQACFIGVLQCSASSKCVPGWTLTV